jgi:hypothetical protein
MDPPPDSWGFQAAPELLEKLAADLAADFRLRPFLRTIVQLRRTSSVHGSLEVERRRTLFARNYARRMEGEEVHDAIAKASGVAGVTRFRLVRSVPGRFNFRIEPTSNAAVNNFMNTFRGNRTR